MELVIPARAALWFLPFVLPIAIWVSWSDMKFLKIPNKAVLALLGVFLIVGLIALPFPEYVWRLPHFAVVLVIGFVANVLRLVGAGDAKFAAAMAPLVAFGDITAILYLLAIIILAAYATHRIFQRIPAIRRLTPDWQSWDNKNFPMGLPLSGTLAAYLILGTIYGASPV